MRKPLVLLLAICLGLVSFSAATPPAINLTPMINLAKDVAVLHRNTQDRVSELTAKMTTLSDKISDGAALSREDQATLADVIEAGATLPRALEGLNTEMGRLRSMLLQQNFSSLDDKFTAWDNAYDTAEQDGTQFRAAARAVQKAGGGAALADAARKALNALSLLNQDLSTMHERFQIIANLLEILQQAGVRALPPSDRVLGETFEAHCKRTGHCQTSSPKNPGRLFDAHSIYAINDPDPKHTVWACEATIGDYLKGIVKGTSHPYLNTAKISYCIRCHAYRDGECDNRWCNLEFSDEFERDAKIIQETANVQ